MLQNHKDQYAKGKISIGVRSGDHSGGISIDPDVQSHFFEKPHQRSFVHMLWNGEGLHPQLKFELSNFSFSPGII